MIIERENLQLLAFWASHHLLSDTNPCILPATEKLRQPTQKSTIAQMYVTTIFKVKSSKQAKQIKSFVHSKQRSHTNFWLPI